MFQVFHGGGIILAITGVGKNAASVCVSRVLTQVRPEGRLLPEDLVISFGCAGCTDYEVGDVLQISRILDQDSAHWYYPDLCIATDFPSAPLITSSRPVACEDDHDLGGFLYDMEGSAVFASASYFGGPHQILLFKAVSDLLDPDSVTPEGLKYLMAAASQPLIAWMEGLMGEVDEGADCANETESLHDLLVEQMHLSTYQSRELTSLLHYCALSNIPVEPVLDTLRQEELLPAPNKRKGSAAFEAFKSGLLQSLR